jgi:hypothetical protein
LINKHHKDPAYNNVVLHVVIQHDQDVKNLNGTVPPVLELPLIKRCRSTPRKSDAVPVSLSELAVRRLQRKTAELKVTAGSRKRRYRCVVSESLFLRLRESISNT